MNCEVDRLSRRILMFQKEEKRTGIWFTSTKEIAEQCGQINTLDQVLQLSKDEWKKIWKETIWKKDEMSVRERAKGMTKMRTVEATAYRRKRLCHTAQTRRSRDGSQDEAAHDQTAGKLYEQRRREKV